MNNYKTAAERYNDRMDKIFAPELARLKRVTTIAEKILKRLNEKVDMNYCGLVEHEVIDIIQRIISESNFDRKE